MSANDKLTRQGVRNLDVIPGKSRGIRLEMPPPRQGEILCRHRNGYESACGLWWKCTDCGKWFEVKWP